MRGLRIAFAFLALASASVLLSAVTSPDSNKQGSHCVVLIEPVASGESDSVVHEPRCFDNFAEALSEATDGTDELIPAGRPVRQAEPR